MPDTADLVGQIIEGCDPGAFVTKFILVAEIIDAAGERSIFTDTHDDATRWDSYGLLTEALNAQHADQIRRDIADSD